MGVPRMPRPTNSERSSSPYDPLGMKLLRIWVPDTSAPRFAPEAARQASLLRGAPEEAEALDYIEQCGDFESIAE